MIKCGTPNAVTMTSCFPRLPASLIMSTPVHSNKVSTYCRTIRYFGNGTGVQDLQGIALDRMQGVRLPVAGRNSMPQHTSEYACGNP